MIRLNQRLLEQPQARPHRGPPGGLGVPTPPGSRRVYRRTRPPRARESPRGGKIRTRALTVSTGPHCYKQPFTSRREQVMARTREASSCRWRRSRRGRRGAAVPAGEGAGSAPPPRRGHRRGKSRGAPPMPRVVTMTRAQPRARGVCGPGTAASSRSVDRQHPQHRQREHADDRGAGATVLPGFIDTHCHTDFSSSTKDPQRTWTPAEISSGLDVRPHVVGGKTMHPAEAVCAHVMEPPPLPTCRDPPADHDDRAARAGAVTNPPLASSGATADQRDRRGSVAVTRDRRRCTNGRIVAAGPGASHAGPEGWPDG